MSGILNIEKKNSYLILSEKFPQSFLSGHLRERLSPDLQTKLNNMLTSDIPKKTKVSRDSGEYAQNVRLYFEKDGLIYSCYESILQRPHYYYSVSLKYAIFLISDVELSGAIINNGSISLKSSFHQPAQLGTNASKKQSRRDERLLAHLTALLQSWKEELKQVNCVFISCSQEVEEFFYEQLNVKNLGYYKTGFLQRIPFAVDGASLELLNRVWDKLFRIVEHGPKNEFMKAVESSKITKITDVMDDGVTETRFICSTKQQRRDEKQRWPGINPQKKNDIHEALLSNNYEGLQDLVGNDQEISDYLSTTHEKLGGQTFMHHIVKEDLVESVQFLLDVGCDPNLFDDNGKVAYEYAKSMEMKQTFVDFRNEHPERHQWTKCLIPEEVIDPELLLHVNSAKNTPVKNKNTSSKSKKKQTKYVDMIDDDFDYEDDELDFDEYPQYNPINPKQSKVNIDEVPIEEVESDQETNLRAHSLLDEERRPREQNYYYYYKPVWTTKPMKMVGNIKVTSKPLRKFLEERMQPAVRTFFSESAILYSGYSAILGGFNTLHNRAFKPHVVFLINDDHFAGAAYDNGKVCRRKTLHRNGANWTKLRDYTKGNLVSNRFIEEKLEKCIEDVLKYWTLDIEVKVLYSCPPEFEMALKEHILETHRYATFECVPFVVKDCTSPEVNRVWKKITTITEHGGVSKYENALESEDYNVLEVMLDDPSEVVLAMNSERMWQHFTPDQRKELHKAIMYNDYDKLKHVVDLYPQSNVTEFLGKARAKFGGQTFLHFAVRNNMDQTAKFLLEKHLGVDVKDGNDKLPIDYCQNDEIRSLFGQ